MTGALNLPVKTWLAVLYFASAFIAGGAAFTAGALGFSHTITHTKVVRVEKSDGKPDVVISGASVNPQLAGLTCRIYQAKHKVVCS